MRSHTPTFGPESVKISSVCLLYFVIARRVKIKGESSSTNSLTKRGIKLVRVPWTSTP